MSNSVGEDENLLQNFDFRYSIKCYVENLFGISNEEYDYKKTNVLLNKSTKTFIKNIACMPQKIAKEDILDLKKTFSNEEIFHLILLVGSNKARVELTYISHIIYDIIKSIE
jgi:hypothetical protein